MKIAVIASNGKTGQKIVTEAVNRGLDITAIVRSENKTATDQAIYKDLFDLTVEDLAPFDVVVDAFGVWQPEALIQHETSIAHLINLLKDTPTRLIVVGGAGSLYLDETHTTQLKDTPDFPEAYFPLADSMSKGLALLRHHNNVHWLYVSPAADFQAEGARTGTYTKAGEVFETNTSGESVINYADYAVGIIDEIQQPTADKARISLHN